LGTSFSVRLYPNELSATVRVKTGNVSVFRHSVSATDSAEVLLSPSQQVVFNVSDEKMTKSKVVGGSPLTAAARYSFEFQDAPIREVFNTIKTAYSVEVKYDEAVFSNCSLNASLNDIPFEEKLRLICKAIGAEYKVEGNRVTIFGKGC
jgi:transmembrane sensor